MDDFFRKLYCERTRKSLACSYPHGRLLALVQSNNLWGEQFHRTGGGMHNYMPVSGEDVRGACSGSDFFPAKLGYFVTSSKDGIILCARVPKIYHVGNPITRRWETLPAPPPPEGFPTHSISVGLVSNEECDGLGGKITNFRDIIATFGLNQDRSPRAQGREVIPIETYSSRTREWRRSRLISDVPVNVRFGVAPSFSGGFLHWFAHDGKSIVAYDPSSLDEEDKEDHCDRGFVPRKHVIQVTNSPCHFPCSRIVWRSDNGQTMWYGGSDFSRGVEVFRKRDESDEWTCVCRLASEARMIKDILGLTQKDIDKELALAGEDCVEELDRRRQTLWLVAFIPWNPRLVMMRYWDNIYVYDCIKKKFDHQVIHDGECHYTEFSWEWTPYFHSLANSTLNLGHDRCFSI